LKTELY